MNSEKTLKIVLNNIVKHATHPKMKVKTKIFDISNNNAIPFATKCLEEGQVIALPTDTIYGFACNANCPKAIQRLYSIKRRDFKKPVAICVADLKNLRYWGEANHLSDELLRKLLPGPFTIVLNKTEYLNNPHLNPGVQKIGIRIPNFQFIQKLCVQFNQPLALTSANKSNEISSLCIEEFEDLWIYLSAIFNGGKVSLNEKNRAGSTVIDLSIPGKCKILRKGMAYSETMNIMKEFNISIE